MIMSMSANMQMKGAIKEDPLLPEEASNISPPALVIYLAAIIMSTKCYNSPILRPTGVCQDSCR
jgi:hypothetical protein